MSPRAYQPYEPVTRPGGKPTSRPAYRVLVHRQYRELWDQLVPCVGLTNTQQFYDHVANTPGQPPAVGNSTVLKGRIGDPHKSKFSRTVHYEISGAGRINYQYCDEYDEGLKGDVHPVVFILTIDLSSH